MATNHKEIHNFELGLTTRVDTSNVTTPTAAELIAAYGAAANNKGLVAIQDDNNADTTVKAVFCNGTSYFFVALTKAT
jgi:uncharacterized iron-regulated protein